jgi:quercetin dioxygenase-like cupin family protein
MINRRRFASCALCAVVGLVASKVDASAQATGGVTRTILQKTEYPGDKMTTILVMADIEAGATVARHTHPGVESAYLVEGGGTLSVKGQPDRVLKPGDGYHVAAETPHALVNGPQKTRVVVTYVVDKDKPLTTPAPA